MTYQKGHIHLFRDLVLILSVIMIVATGQTFGQDISWMLPTSSELKEIKAEGSSQKARGMELFMLINGGAELFYNYGFQQAILQEYRAGDKSVNLEVYQLASSADAYGVYTMKGGTGGKNLPLGHESLLHEYYCLFWKDSFFITVTGFDSSQETKNALLQLVKAVDVKIKDKGSKPELEKLIHVKGLLPQSVHYFQKYFHFDNWLNPDPKSLSDVKEGFAVDYGPIKVMLLRYSNQPDCLTGFEKFVTSLKVDSRFTFDKQESNHAFFTTAAKDILTVLRLRSFILALSGKDQQKNHDVMTEFKKTIGK